ncbi:Tyrosine-protein kinase Btk29A [Acromyrmex echinatior]|uniref:Tyrosine-protein kinase Btk29A n=1 Tax=Acromyrmex echinatior TaxID=103372 RepID=F4W6U4_ACREC|nr:Tyrosine-protein kinase Btk29A [Acromyrmex echinatior]
MADNMHLYRIPIKLVAQAPHVNFPSYLSFRFFVVDAAQSVAVVRVLLVNLVLSDSRVGFHNIYLSESFTTLFVETLLLSCDLNYLFTSLREIARLLRIVRLGRCGQPWRSDPRADPTDLVILFTTSRALSYNVERRKERGRIAVENVHVVETASLGNGGSAVSDVAGGGGGGGGDAAGGGGGIPSGLPFQVGYREAGQEYTLYLLAAREQDRAEWIRAIRAVCSENSGLSGRYHAGLWSGKRWSCCRLSTRSAEGCDTCSSWSSKPTTNATNPSSTTMSASTTSTTSVPGSNIINNTISTTIITSDHRSQSNAEANNNPIIQSQTRSTIGSYFTFITFLHAFILYYPRL